MTENPTISFPASPYCRVRARVASIWADGPDADTSPDWRPAVGEKVTLTPSIGSQLLTYNVGGTDPIIVTVERVDCEVDADGWLVKSDGRPVYIAPTDDPLLSATGWTWTATIKGKSIVFSAPAGGTVNLALFVATPAVPTTPTPSGGGSGVELVSGTVTLSSSGAPIREFYTTAAATIGGVVFGEGTAVVFRRAPGGQWGYKVVEDWTPITSDPDPGLITVTATAPTWADDAINGGGTWTTPTITGVTYSPASGSASPGQTVTVTATPSIGYQLSGTSSWSHTFPAAPSAEVVFFTDFGSDTLAQPPAGFTSRWVSPSVNTIVSEGTAASGKALELTASSQRVLLSCDSLGSPSGTVEVVTRFRATEAAFIAHAIRIHCSGGTSSESGYHANIQPSTSKAGKYTAGTSVDVGSSASRTLAVNAWSWLRMRVESGTVYLRWWADEDPEPGTWNVTESDSTHTSGWVGIGCYKNTLQFDRVGIATDGSTAPKEAP